MPYLREMRTAILMNPLARARDSSYNAVAGLEPETREGMVVALEGLDLETLEATVSSLGVAKKRQLAPGEKPDSPEKSPLKRVRQRHHALAQAVASAPPGMTLKQVAISQGVTPDTLYRLCSDTTFKGIVANIRAGLTVQFEATLDKVKDLGDSAIDELQDRLDTDPTQFTAGQLAAIAQLSLDRSGHGPQNKTEVNVNVGFAQKLSSARQRAKQHTIDVTPNKVETDDKDPSE